MMKDGERSEKDAFLTKADSCLNQGLYQTAQDIALDWLKRYPGDAEARVVLCHAWTRMGKLDKVKQMLEEVDEAIYGMSLIYARMGDICSSSGLNREAMTFYRKFLDFNPNAPMTKEIKEKMVSLSSSSEEALFLEEELPKHPMPGLQTVTMAELYLKQGHKELAEEVLGVILEKDASNERALTMLNKLRVGAPDTQKLPYRKSEKVIEELHRWLNNLQRIKIHAA